MNSLRTLSTTLLLFALLVLPAVGEDKADAKADAKAKKPAVEKSLIDVEAFKATLDDVDKLNKFFGITFSKIASEMNRDADAAEALLNALEATLKEAETDNAEVKQLIGRGQGALDFYRQRLELARTSLDDIATKLDADPNDVKNIQLYFSKAAQEISATSVDDPKGAMKLLDKAKTYLAGVSEKSSSEEAKKAIKSGVARSLGSIERRIASALKLTELIGKDSSALEVDAWVNGSSLTDGDLKGKVVVLDFWAVWCGPCVATFPHLIDWHEKYDEKEFAIIGLTRYYKRYGFDSEKGSLKQSKTPLARDEELAMLEQFAKHHKLQHRLAVQTAKSKMADYYGVSGIPHVVVIDKQGKVQLIKVGSGEANAKAIEAKIEELIGS